VSQNLGDLRTVEEETGGRESELGTSSDRRGRNQSELAIEKKPMGICSKNVDYGKCIRVKGKAVLQLRD
jgi:hypothetical protein